MSKSERERSHGQMRHFQRVNTSWWQVQTTRAWSLSACQAPKGPEAEAAALGGPTASVVTNTERCPRPQGLREGRRH